MSKSVQVSIDTGVKVSSQGSSSVAAYNVVKNTCADVVLATRCTCRPHLEVLVYSWFRPASVQTSDLSRPAELDQGSALPVPPQLTVGQLGSWKNSTSV